MPDNSPKFIAQLAEYKAAKGDCNVPANYKDNPSLGRWVAAVRFKRKIGTLPAPLVAKLEEMGFCWAPGKDNWNRLFQELVEFKKKFNNCNVPEHWAENPSLANWVQSQRHRRKKGRLDAERVAELDKLGFVWQIYKCEHKSAPQRSSPVIEMPKDPMAGERLYVVAPGQYAQYGGTGPMPPALEKVVAARRGEMPPFIPMPVRPVVFNIGDEDDANPVRIKWSGSGIVPAQILAYLKENGVLPRYDL